MVSEASLGRKFAAQNLLTDTSVSQFTLLASTKKGTKPDFHGAANPDEAKHLYQVFVEKVKAGYQADRVKDGRFQAMMEVALVNDGPVSFPVTDLQSSRTN